VRIGGSGKRRQCESALVRIGVSATRRQCESALVGNRQAASGPGYATECVHVWEGMASKAAAPTTRAAAALIATSAAPVSCRGCRRGPTWLRCALVRIGARLGFRAPAKVRWGCSGVAWLRGICSTVIGNTAQRRHVHAAAKHTRARWACAQEGDSRKGTLATCRARRCVAVRRWGTFEYADGVLGVLTWGTVEYSQWGTLRTSHGYYEYSHL
jgi:hypothetical protein